MSSNANCSIPKAVEDFTSALYQSPLALRRIQDFYDDDKLTDVTKQEKCKILQKFKLKHFNATNLAELLKELEMRLDNRIAVYQTKNQNHRKQCENLMENFMDFLCEDYKASVLTKLSLDPNMNLEDLDELLKNSKSEIMIHFQNHWKPGLEPFHQELSTKFEKRINVLEVEFREKQQKYLKEQMEDDGELFDQVKHFLLKMSSYVKRDVETSRVEKIPKEDLMERAKSMHDFLLKKGRKLGESYRRVYAKLVAAVTGSMEYLESFSRNPNISFEDAIQWAQDLCADVKKCLEERKTSQVDPKPKRLKLIDDTSVLPHLNPLIFRLTDKGISMGTYEGDEFKMLENWAGSSLTPLYVGINGSQHLVCGPDAMTCFHRWWIPGLFGLRPEFCDSDNFEFEDQYMFSLKADTMPSKVTFKLDDDEITQETSIEFVLGLLMKSLKQCAEEKLQGYFSKAVITLPIWFRSSHRVQIKAAAKVAGFSNSILVNEEAAAAYALAQISDAVIGEELLVLSENFGIVSAVQFKDTNLDNDDSNHKNSDHPEDTTYVIVSRHCRLSRQETEGILNILNPDNPTAPARQHRAKQATCHFRKWLTKISSPATMPYIQLERNMIPPPSDLLWYFRIKTVLMLADSDWGLSCQDIIRKNRVAAGDFNSATLVMSGAGQLDLKAVDQRLDCLYNESMYTWLGNCDDGYRAQNHKSILLINISALNPDKRKTTRTSQGKTSDPRIYKDEDDFSDSDGDYCLESYYEYYYYGDFDDISSRPRESNSEPSELGFELSEKRIYDKLTKEVVIIYQENLFDKTKAIIGRLRACSELMKTFENIVARFERNAESIITFKELICTVGKEEKTFTDPKKVGWLTSDMNDEKLLSITHLVSTLVCNSRINDDVAVNNTGQGPGNGPQVSSAEPEPGPSCSSNKGLRKRKICESPPSTTTTSTDSSSYPGKSKLKPKKASK